MNRNWMALASLVLALSLLVPVAAASPMVAMSEPPGQDRNVPVEALPGTIQRASSSPVEPKPHPILSDVRIRRAMAYCTDKKAIVAAAFPHLTPAEQQALIMDSFIPEGHWAYTAPATTYPYAPQQGKDLLTDAGWILPPGGEYRVKDGKELALPYYTTSGRHAIAPVFEAQMKACGIHLLLAYRGVGWLFGKALDTRDFEVAEWALSLGDNPGGDYIYACDEIPLPSNGWSGGNLAGWCHPAASEAIVKASDTQRTQEERKAYYATFLELHAQEQPRIILFMAEEGTVDDYSWEQIVFNHQTFDQTVELMPKSEAVLSYTDFEGDQGSITAPEGAVQETVTLSYRPLGEPEHWPPQGSAMAKAFRLWVEVGGVPQETYAFAEPLRVKVGYGAAGPYVKDSLNLYYWDGDQYQDAYMSCAEGERYKAMDAGQQTFEVNVCHLSEFALTGTKYRAFLPVILR